MPRGSRKTGDGEPYSPADEADLADYVEDAIDEADLAILRQLDEEAEAEEEAGEEPEPPTGTITVEAQVEWAGDIDDNGRDGVRRTRLEHIPLDGIQRAAADLEAAKQAAASSTAPEGGYRSYRAKGWRAQLRQTLSTQRGRAAAEAAGLNPDTIRRWQNGTQAASKASRAKIASIYGDLRDPRSADARHVQEAQRGVAEALTSAIREQYGVNVRLRDIRGLRIERED